MNYESTHQDMIVDNSVIDRFLEKVEKFPGGCWEWRAVKNSDGYGNFKYAGTILKAHRISYRIYTGYIPAKMSVLQTCDNPGCVCPGHLFLGTPMDNARDRESKGRGHDKSGEANGRATLTAASVREIRKLYAETKYTQREIGRLFDISHTVVSKIVRRDLWKSVE